MRTDDEGTQAETEAGTLEGAALERAVLDAVDREALLADLAALVATAPVGGTPGEVVAQRWGAQRLRELGLTVDEWDVDLEALRASDDHPGEEVDRRELVGVVGTWAAEGDGAPSGEVAGLVLCGHTDVVPVGDRTRWTDDPFLLVRQGDRVVGRGACDMLGGVAAVLAAVRALRAAGATLRRPLAVHLVSGEEDGGVGAFATLRAGHRGAACVIAEPTGGAVIPANAGSLTFRLEIPGRAAHGSTRMSGESAVDHLEPVLAALRALEARRNARVGGLFAHLDLAAPLSVGMLRAGDWASTVPDLLVTEGRYGVLPGESLDSARAVFEEAVAGVGRGDPWLAEHPVRVSWPGGSFAPGALPEGDPLLGQVLDAAISAAPAVAGGNAEAGGSSEAARPRVEGAPYGSDLRHYAAYGIPTLQYGPGLLADAHAVDEGVTVAELVSCARAYALLALRRCGGTGPAA
ncbi:M20/M25/M40 family metallo-hydrolase [Phycicoccus sp. M110.8]|uniref:M20/M25/M40 family metallo-hydrolase n=1 Tax=Phycicoccus sp. M110.8 TaxID=3075433 RepID=UPI0028FD74F0|nr:M20/M25/M40 family metallo-hydrolase [Phycicoccus sp. M110.8]MDU0312097.1 M20/M25/M40 family metallo-hydrolase [Phycicoccus sp. M110.8]